MPPLRSALALALTLAAAGCYQAHGDEDGGTAGCGLRVETVPVGGCGTFSVARAREPFSVDVACDGETRAGVFTSGLSVLVGGTGRWHVLATSDQEFAGYALTVASDAAECGRCAVFRTAAPSAGRGRFALAAVEDPSAEPRTFLFGPHEGDIELEVCAP
ncbi:MAG: hypothetical protein AB7S26_40575 [Sandaracinaceae bacterium]